MKKPKKGRKVVATKPSDPGRRDFISKALKLGAAATGVGALSTLARISVADDEVYDYIVVGSGAGGGPVAANLALAGYRVLLLEAGGREPNRNVEIPAFHGFSTEDPNLSWHFYVKHYSDSARQALDSKYVRNRGILYPRSGTLGGCTAHNAMITMYPDNQDWDNIERLTGDSTWNSRNMRRYFQRLERNRYVTEQAGNASWHGYRGWLQTEQTDPSLILGDPRLIGFPLSAVDQCGLGNEVIDKLLRQRGNYHLDPNDWRYVTNKQDGVFLPPKATRNGRRNGTRERILETMAAHPDRLILRSHSLATQILFDQTDPTRAIGVEYMEGAHLYRADTLVNETTASAAPRRRVFCRREVIISTGAFNSPQLLMLSGIGDSNELARHGIATRVNLPGVGKNLQDRYEICVTSSLNFRSRLGADCTFGAPGDPCMEAYRRDPTHSAYSTNGIVLSVIRRSSAGRSTPDLCIFGFPGTFHGYFPGWSATAIDQDHFTWAVLKGHTNNTAGYVALKSADPRETPEINFRYFDEGNDHGEEDLNAVVEGVEFVEKMNKQLAARVLIHDRLQPPREITTREGMKEHVKKEAWGHHASCSNKMGPASDSMAVVDSKFRVHGTRGLRIVDASVFPKIPGLFIVVPIYMIAEKASDDIIHDASLTRG